MPPTDSKNKQGPKQSLRRSPSFLQVVVSDPINRIIPNPEQRLRARVTSDTLLIVTQKKKACSPIRRRSNRSKKLNEPCKVTQRVDASKSRVTRSGKLNLCVEECNAEKVLGSLNRGNGELERVVTRSSGRRDVAKGKSVKNKGECSKRSCNHDSEKFDDNKNEGVFSRMEKKGLDEEVLEKVVVIKKGAVVTAAIVVHEEPTNERDGNKMQKKIGVKRKRNQFEAIGGNGISKSWTGDQELALERAYLEAKPTPQFWKKVSRLVPGKSAQECFDKIHGSHMTPPQPRLRCKPRISKSQNPFSASKFLNSSPAAKKPKSCKQKSHVVQRTVRHMLQNQYKVEQDSNADLFSVLEPTFTASLSSNLMLSTPDRNPNEVLKRCHERSSTAHKKSVSRFSSSYGTQTLASPPVLKQVKNKALHEKYIDQLNCREANRKAACARAEKRHKSEVIIEEGSVQRKYAMKAAKNALVFGARDAINEFQHQQATILNDLFDDEGCSDNNDGNDEEDGQVLF